MMLGKLWICAVGAALAVTLAFAAPQARKGKGGDPAKGKEVFEQCGVCHNADSTEKKMGPGLKGLFKRAKLNNGKPVNEANIRAVINAGGNGMPSFDALLSSQDKENVLAYLKTL